ncbi:MAG TPA: type II toxin-antitoxin system VapC family toxin [Phenylobacterium sp.]|nr:type II toxin-antitoxin system VapC family toxin [Phenylobacterium sp.]
MTFLLDTNIVIHMRDGDPAVRARVEALDGSILLSIITRVELEGGLERDPINAAVRRERLDAILQSMPVVEFDHASADAYRQILSAVGYSRRKLLDRMIAAQALVHRATLVTRNPTDFRDIAGLDVLIC